MNIGKVIENKLAGITDRITPNFIPQGESLPAIVYHIIDNKPTDTKGNTSVRDTYRVQVSIYGETYAEVDTWGASVRSALDGVNNETVQGVAVKRISYMDESDLYEEDAEVHHRAMDFSVRVTP